MSRAARLVPVLALVFGVTVGLWILFGPTYTSCSTSATAGQPQGPMVCGSSSLIEVQGGNIFPAPLLFIAVWALAPALAVIGTRSNTRWYALAMTGVAFAIEMTSFISIGGGFVFALLIAPLMLLTLVLVAGSRGGSAVAPLR